MELRPPPFENGVLFGREFCLRGFEGIGIIPPPLVSDIKVFPTEMATFFSGFDFGVSFV